MRRRSSVMSVVAVVAATGLLLSGCTSDKKNANSGPAATVEIKPTGDYNPLERDQIKDGGELTLPILEVPEQSNSLHGNAIVDGTTLWRWYNPQMTLADGDGTWHPNPAYLTNVNAEEVDGKTVVTYDINPDAVFNDGTPIDWRVFETMWKFNNAENPDVVANSTDGYDQIESVTAGESDKQAVVTYKQAYPWWQALFDRVLHPSVADAQTFNEGYLKNPHPEWGAGPYKVDQFDYNSGTVSFVPNEKWWGEKPKLDKVTYRQMESQATINAYQAGEVDAVEITNKDHLAVAKTVKDTTLRGTLRPSNYLVTLNAKTPTLEDVKVREAMFTGINRETLAQVRFNGMDYTENLPGSFALFQNQKGYQDNFGDLVTYNLQPGQSQAAARRGRLDRRQRRHPGEGREETHAPLRHVWRQPAGKEHRGRHAENAERHWGGFAGCRTPQLGFLQGDSGTRIRRAHQRFHLLRPLWGCLFQTGVRLRFGAE